MGIEYDIDEIARIKLHKDACELAVEGAEDFAHAGREEHEQLMQGIRSYLFACRVGHLPGAKIARRDHIPLPLTVEDAKWMVEMGQKFLATALLEPQEFDDIVKIP